MVLNENKADVRKEIMEVSKMFEIDAKQKGIKYELIFEFIHKMIIVDIKRICQIVIILLSNAFKYTYEGKIQLICKEVDRIFRIEVSDTGIGIK